MGSSEHKVFVGDSSNMSGIEDGSINLIVTSPPYPMIEMWDDMFIQKNPCIATELVNGMGLNAFKMMHRILYNVWVECDRVLADGGFICINIGDATRNVGQKFQMYPNHSEVINTFLEMGYSVLPDIHWKKPNSSPTKFMGSGMLPAGAYVTYEHEYILIFRKGGNRKFSDGEKDIRRKSAFFWEERNIWFSDLWDVNGTSQHIDGSIVSRKKSAAFPLEIPYRLINMYSIKGDTVLDPFMGTGTTTIASMILNRNSIGIEIDDKVAEIAKANIESSMLKANDFIRDRVEEHLIFLYFMSDEQRDKCYTNRKHGFLVKTQQEKDIEIQMLDGVVKCEDGFTCHYMDYINYQQQEGDIYGF